MAIRKRRSKRRTVMLEMAVIRGLVVDGLNLSVHVSSDVKPSARLTGVWLHRDKTDLSNSRLALEFEDDIEWPDEYRAAVSYRSLEYCVVPPLGWGGTGSVLITGPAAGDEASKEAGA